MDLILKTISQQTISLKQPLKPILPKQQSQQQSQQQSHTTITNDEQLSFITKKIIRDYVDTKTNKPYMFYSGKNYNKDDIYPVICVGSGDNWICGNTLNGSSGKTICLMCVNKIGERV